MVWSKSNGFGNRDPLEPEPFEALDFSKHRSFFFEYGARGAVFVGA